MVRRKKWSWPTKSGSLRCCLPLMSNSMQKKKLRYHSFLSRDFDDQRILQSEWTRGITGHFQPKEKVPDATLACWLPPYKKLRDCWIFSRDINDQRILQSDWKRGTTGHTQPNVVVSDATFFLWLPPSKKSKKSINSSHRYWWSKSPATWLHETYNRPRPIKNGSLRCHNQVFQKVFAES